MDTPRLSRRELNGFTAQLEKKVLVALARRAPAWLSPDHLTALGALGMAGAGLCYRLVPFSSLALLAANLCLLANWLGDSLDGTLARVRERQRPRYGFYVDHLVDGVGAILVMAGLAGSGLVQPVLAAAGLAAYLLMQLHIALKAHVTGVFRIAFHGVGGTELRLLVAALNTFAWLAPSVSHLAGIRLFDVALAVGLVGLVGTLAWDAARTAYALDREESALLAAPAGQILGEGRVSRSSGVPTALSAARSSAARFRLPARSATG